MPASHFQCATRKRTPLAKCAPIRVRALLAVLVAITCTRAPAAHALVCTTAPEDVHFSSTWAVTARRSCWNHTLSIIGKPTSFSSLKQAESACAATVACSGVHDLGCKGFEYKLCSANYELDVSYDAPAHCVHGKPAAKGALGGGALSDGVRN